MLWKSNGKLSYNMNLRKVFIVSTFYRFYHFLLLCLLVIMCRKYLSTCSVLLSGFWISEFFFIVTAGISQFGRWVLTKIAHQAKSWSVLSSTYITLETIWHFRDPQSGIMRNDFALGRTPRDIDILPWQRQSTAEYIEIKYKIPDGIPAWAKIRSINNGKIILVLMLYNLIENIMKMFIIRWLTPQSFF